MVQKAGRCSKRWFLKALFQHLKKPGDTFTLTIFNENVRKMAQFLPNVNLSTASPDMLTEALLSMPDLQVTYDAAQKKLIDITTINI